MLEVQITTFGRGALDNRVRYNGVDTLIVTATSDFAPGDSVKIKGLRFRNFSAASSPSRLGLSITGRVANTFDERIIQIGAPFIRTAGDLSFVVGDQPTPVGVIQIGEHDVAASITADNDIRIVIPKSLRVEWDISVVDVDIIGTAAEKVDRRVIYPDPKTVEIQVKEDFEPSEYISIVGLKMKNFSAISPKDTLCLSVNDERTINTKDIHSVRIGDPVLEFEKDQVFVPGDEEVLDVVKIREAPEVGSVTAKEDIRIWIPSGIGLVFDEKRKDRIRLRGNVVDDGKIGEIYVRRGGEELYIDVLEDFVGGDWLEISGICVSFFGPVRRFRLQLSVNGGVDRESRGTVRVGWPRISSLAVHGYVEGDPISDIGRIVIREDTTAGGITKEGDIRIIIPSELSVDWHIQDTEAVFGGSASGKVSPTVHYEGRDTLVVDVTEDFSAGDSLVIEGLRFEGFEFPSRGRLRLSVTGGRSINAQDDYETVVYESPGLSLGRDWGYVLSDSAGALSLRIWERSEGGVLGRLRDEIWVKLPEGCPVEWDEVEGEIKIVPEGKVEFDRYDGCSVVFRVREAFSKGDSVYVEGLRIRYSGQFSSRRLGLSVSSGESINYLSDGSIRVGQPYMYTEIGDQVFVVGGDRVQVGALVIGESDTVGVMSSWYGIRIKIPEEVGLEWDTTEVDVEIEGEDTTVAKLRDVVRYLDSKTVVLDFREGVEGFGASERVVLRGLWSVSYTHLTLPTKA